MTRCWQYLKRSTSGVRGSEKAALKKVVSLAAKVGNVLVATADSQGLPHVAAAGKLALKPGGKVAVTEWFCPGTMANLEVNPHIALVIWDATSDNGYQLLGELVEMKILGMLDGYVPAKEAKSQVPQVERQMDVRVDRIIEFRRAPHTDTEEQ